MSLTMAIRLLTRIWIPGKETEKHERTLFWFPFVGALLGLVSVLISLIPLPPSILSILIIIASVYLTRALHYDGLADFADGLGGGFTKERALEIMRDSHIGAFGTIALILVFLLQYSLLTVVVHIPLSLILTPIIGRFAQVWVTSLMKYAREGEGMAAILVRRSAWYHALLPTLQILLLVGYLFISKNPYVEATLLALGFATIITMVVALTAHKRLGGITGDVLGSVEVLAEVGALVGFAVGLA